MQSCVLVSFQQLEESIEGVVERRVESDAGLNANEQELSEQLVAVQALEAARCTRRALSCQQRFDCLRGVTVGQFTGALDGGAPPDAATVDLTPSWEVPWTASGPDPLWTDPPWADAGAKASVYLVPGVDSPSCARCTIERCPTFAYQCFSAEGDSSRCPNGDCCESLRRCVERRGGYAATAQPVDFYKALYECEIARPHAAQELANLQGCAQVACAGCASFDKGNAITSDGDGGFTTLDGGP